MALKGNRGWGKMLAEAVKEEVDDPNFEAAPFTSWLDTWFDPVTARNRFRWLLKDYLTGALEKIPSEVTIRYLEELIVDLRELDQDHAVDRFVDKVLPKLLLNEPDKRSSGTR